MRFIVSGRLVNVGVGDSWWVSSLVSSNLLLAEESIVPSEVLEDCASTSNSTSTNIVAGSIVVEVVIVVSIVGYIVGGGLIDISVGDSWCKKLLKISIKVQVNKEHSASSSNSTSIDVIVRSTVVEISRVVGSV